MTSSVAWWLVFAVFVASMLALDLLVFSRRAHTIHLREALLRAAMWVGLAVAFGAGVYFVRGHKAGLEFFTGYLIEESLSVDNLFVFLLIFSYFGVKPEYQHKVLFWGILGAIVMRLVFIFAGVTLLQRFHFLFYLFGAVLIVSGIRMGMNKEAEVRPERNPVLKVFRRLFPVTPQFEGGRFFTRRAGRMMATPLFVVLLAVETTDLVFAVDSIPAVLAITRDPFIVYTSNIFAILGLRTLYFALAGVMDLFHYLNYGLATILVLIGAKMMLSDLVHIPTHWTLAMVGVVLAVSVVASVLVPSSPHDSASDRKQS